jgi:NADH-quinone oxidoreductase subunit J
MTTRPRLADFNRGVVTGVAAVALFGLMAAVFLTAQFEQPSGFPADISVVKSIGFAMFDITAEDVIVGEGFLAVFLIIAIALDAALDGSLMLAERDDGGEE